MPSQKNSSSKIIIGTGIVGSTFPYSLIIHGLHSEIVNIDINKERTQGNCKFPKIRGYRRENLRFTEHMNHPETENLHNTRNLAAKSIQETDLSQDHKKRHS
jgi:hypothetical protein